ncbi:MAG TPA: ABC transporter ATP-binding protein [Mycobacteriales bacterium]|nr:ABC transporter ATP-binding protein [Mycobacteriales bacterium]
MTEPLLRVEGVDFSYGPLQVLFDASIEVGHAERVCLLGTNGAGKSTLLRVVSGLVSPTRGAVSFDGADITRLDAAQRAAAGLIQIAGGRATFPSLSTLQNIRLGAYRRAAKPHAEARVEEAIALFPALRPRLEQPAGTLSGGEQQMVAIARAIVADPRLLIIDELSLGLAPIVMEQILATIEQLAARGLSMLIVEQSLNVALSVSERAYFMERGAIRFSGPTDELTRRDDLVRSVFFGSAAP